MDTLSQHIFLDAVCENEWKEEYLNKIKEIIEKNFTVVNRIEHKFHPHGETIAFILAESHFTIHTYPEHNYFSMDIYICNLSANLDKVVEEIKIAVPLKRYESKILHRGKITHLESKQKATLIGVLTVLVATSTMLYELLLAQSLSTTMGNTALRYNLTIGIYIAAMGFGALLYNKIIKGNKFKSFINIELGLSLIGGLAPIFVLFVDFIFNYLAVFFNISFYHPMIQWTLSTTNHSLIFLIGFIAGIELPLLMDMVGEYYHFWKNRILALDYLGTLIAAIAFPIIILPNFHIFTIGYIVSITNAIAALIVVISFNISSKISKFLSFLFIVFWLLVLINSSSINNFLESSLYFSGAK